MRPLIVIPVYNEAATVGEVVAGALAHAPVLVVDDGSLDGSADIARGAGAEVVHHPRRLGKGQALRSGIAAARARGASVMVTLDGDGQHDPRDVPTLLAAASRAPEAIVLGCRLADGTALPPGRLNAIRLAGFFANWASGVRIADTQSGFRVYPMSLFGDVRLRRGGFVLETEVLLEAAGRGRPIVEVGVTAIPRAIRRSRFRPIVDGLAIGVYLSRATAARWALEGAAAVHEVTSIFRSPHRRDRHAAWLESAASYGGSFAPWSLAVGVDVARRTVSTLRGWWRHSRRRRATVVAGATAAAPVVLGAALLQALGGRFLPDLVSPLVVRLYSQDRLDAGGHDRPLTAAPGPLFRRAAASSIADDR